MCEVHKVPLTALVPGPHDPVLGAGVHGLGCGEHGGVLDSAANRLIGEVVQSRRRPLLGRL